MARGYALIFNFSSTLNCQIVPVAALKQVINRWPESFVLKVPAEKVIEDTKFETLPGDHSLVKNVRHASLVSGKYEKARCLTNA